MSAGIDEWTVTGLVEVRCVDDLDLDEDGSVSLPTNRFRGLLAVGLVGVGAFDKDGMDDECV
jgi:hypothetical protein